MAACATSPQTPQPTQLLSTCATGSEPQRIGRRLDRQRRATRQPDARMVAGTDFVIDAEILAHDTPAVLLELAQLRCDATLPVELTFAFGDDDLRAARGRRHRLLERVVRTFHVVGLDASHPIDTDAAHRRLDGVVRLACRGVALRRRNVLSARRGRIAVVDDDREAVVLVEHGVADAAREPVVPEAAIAHQRDRHDARARS